MKLPKSLITLGAISLLGVLAYLWLNPAVQHNSPDISLLATDGKELRLVDLRGTPVLLTFWATTCQSCVREMPHLIALYKELAPQGLQLIAISMDYDPPNRVLAMQKARNIPYPVVMDIHGAAARAFGKVRMTPTSILIAPDGRIAFRKTGTMDLNRLRQDILAMLDKTYSG
ncbi:MAG: TlpA disulfide reductase family protein [Gammaproteobacteria bacterium]